jgi:hypothetical protein
LFSTLWPSFLNPEIAYPPDDYNWQPILLAGLEGFLLVAAFSLYRRFFASVETDMNVPRVV